jgi:hypothetical protein
VRLLKNPTFGRLVVCCTIVAAFHVGLVARPAIADDVPVPGGIAAFARALDLDPVPDRARFVAELTRLPYDLQRVKTLLASASVPQGGDLVPVPLPAAIWGRAVFHRPVSAANLLGAIVSDRQASLLCHGLAALDDETLEFLAEHPALLARLYQDDAPAFAAFGARLRVHGGRVVVSGGAEAAPLWEAVLGARADQPERFIRELFGRGDARIAYLYDVVGQLDRPNAAFALGLWIDPPSERLARFQKLVDATIAAQHEWRVRTFPFARPLRDIATLLARIRADATGRPVLSSVRLWTHIFEGADLSNTSAADARSSDGVSTVDAAWLAQNIAERDVREREERSDQFAFGQRVFADAGDAAFGSVVAAVRGFARLRMLMLTLERVGITDPDLYAEAARRAHRMSTLDSSRGYAALAQVQGALALVERMVRVRTIDTARAQMLISSLIAVPLNDDGRYGGALTRWIQQTLRPALPEAPSAETAILAALAGRPDAAAPVVAWEGQQYRLDLAASELRRLRRIRDKQGSSTLNDASAIDAAAQTLARDGVTTADVQGVIEALKTIAEELPSKALAEPQILPNGIVPSKGVRDVIDRTLKDLSKLDATKDAGRIGRLAPTLGELADHVLADALLSLAYAVDIGDPDGAVLLAGNVARRHDFGFGLRDDDVRERVAWSLPKQDVVPGLPWHVTGSLLGLDVALAPLVLRRVTTDPVATAPKLTSNERETFAVSVSLMNASALTNADRDAIASAVGRGRERVAALTAASLDAAADEIVMDGWRRRAARWSLAHEPARVPSLFSLTELVRLGGGPAPGALDVWGMSALTSDGCLCLRMQPPGRWSVWIGRPQLGMIATGVADLNLHVAVMLHDLQLPAALARHVLTAAVQDFVDTVRPTDAFDWLTLVRAAQRVSREQVEDYIASAAADGPLVPGTTSRNPGP